METTKWGRMWRKRPEIMEEQEKDLHIGCAEDTGEVWKVAKRRGEWEKIKRKKKTDMEVEIKEVMINSD